MLSLVTNPPPGIHESHLQGTIGAFVVLMLLTGFLNPTRAQESVESLGPDGGHVRQVTSAAHVVYLAGRKGFYRSTDAGVTWNMHVLPPGLRLSRFFTSAKDPDVVFAIDESGDVYRTRDGGASWELFAGQRGLHPIFLNPDDPDVLWAIASNLYSSRLHKSTDGGASWTDINPDDRSQTHTRAWINPYAPDHAIAVVSCCGDVISDSNVHVTYDGGGNWSPGVQAGLDAVHFHEQRPGDVLATSRGRLLHSGDGGLTWEQIGTPPGDFIRWFPNDPAVLYSFAQDEDRFRVVHVFRSTNFGVSWTPIGALEPAVPPRQTAVAFQGDSTIITGAFPHAAWRSDDGGSSWHISNAGIALTSVYDIEASEDLLFAGVEGLGILRSTDDGAHWTTAIPNPSSGSLNDQVRIAGRKVFSNVLPAHLYDGGNWGATGGLAVSEDGGESWDYRPGSKRGPQSFDVSSDGSTLYGGARFGDIEGVVIAGLIKSTDGGRTWRDLAFENVGPTINSIEKVRIDSGDPDRVYVLAALRGSVDLDVLLGSADGGSTWETLAENVESFDLSPSEPETLFYTNRITPWSPAEPQLYRSTDSGQTWEYRGPLPDPDGFVDFVVHPDDANTLFAATIGGEVVESRDGGETWSPLAGKLSASWTEIDVAVSASTRLYGTTYDVGAQRLEVRPTTETSAPEIPSSKRLDLNAFPNPTSSHVRLTLTVEAAGRVSLDVYNVIGQKVGALLNGRHLEAGRHDFEWDGRDDTDRVLSNGVYFISATHEDGNRMTVLQTIAR